MLATGKYLPGFLKLFRCVCLYVCVHTEAINNFWRDVVWYDWLTKDYRFYMAALVIIGNGRTALE